MDVITKPVSTTKNIPCPYCGGRKERHIFKASGEIKVEKCGYCGVDGTVSRGLWQK